MATTASGVTAAHELDELYRLHAAEVFRYAFAVLGNRADAEDVTQTTFVNALRALERGERPRKPTNWLITIAHNLIRQRFRQQQTRPLEVELDRDVAAVEEGDDGPSIDELVRALQRIPPTQRQALVLRELEGRSYGEIGELLGVSQSALEALIFRARRSLTEELENLVTCDHAELALRASGTGDWAVRTPAPRRAHRRVHELRQDGRAKHEDRRAFKALALLPIPFSLTLFKGAPSAAAATGLPTSGPGPRRARPPVSARPESRRRSRSDSRRSRSQAVPGTRASRQCRSRRLRRGLPRRSRRPPPHRSHAGTPSSPPR